MEPARTGSLVLLVRDSKGTLSVNPRMTKLLYPACYCIATALAHKWGAICGDRGFRHLGRVDGAAGRLSSLIHHLAIGVASGTYS